MFEAIERAPFVASDRSVRSDARSPERSEHCSYLVRNVVRFRHLLPEPPKLQGVSGHPEYPRITSNEL